MTLKLITELIVNNTKLQLKYQNEINNIGSIYNDINLPEYVNMDGTNIINLDYRMDNINN